MTDFSTNISPISTISQQQTAPQRRTRTAVQSPIRKYWRTEKRKNSGLVEKLYNKIKNLTGLGVGSKKVEQAVIQAEQGQIDNQQVVDKIKHYSKSQETSAQLFGDALSIGVAAFTFFGLNKAFKYTSSYMKINQPYFDKQYDKVQKARETLMKGNDIPAKERKIIKGIFKTYEELYKTAKSNKRLTFVTVGLAALAGGITKYFALKFNRIGSDEYKLDTTRFRKKSNFGKQEKKRLNRERHRTNWKNLASGTINGLLMPVMFLGGVVGAPIYLAVNSLNRYFIAGKAKDKSVGNYLDNLTNDSLTAGLVTAGIAVPLVRKGNFTKVFNENISKVANDLAGKELKKPDFNTKSAYQQLEETMLDSPKVKSIIQGSMKMDKKINKLTDENIFAVKFQQIKSTETGNSFIDGILAIFGKGKEKSLTSALQEDCPPTRTVKQAQKFINKEMGEDKYELTKLLGVGTIAETYLAKDKEGKEVCIKILKEGISKEKILKDKEKFIDMVKKLPNKSQDEKDYLLRNIEDLADGIVKEVDLKNEMEAAQKLAKNTQVANVVKPIEVKNNVYVMEKATGVSLKSFMDLNWLYIAKDGVEKGENIPKLFGIEDKVNLNSFGYRFIKRQILKHLDKQIKKTTERMPAFKDIRFKKEDTDYILQEYQKVFVEQFHKVDKNGKTIHADVHPGNIFINPEVLKTKQGKLFTLIDTGNTIDMNIKQSMHALNLTEYVQTGNAIDIAEYVLDGAKLPNNMTKEEAVKKIAEELKKCFFDKETELGKQNTDKMLSMADSIMQKYDIIPSSTQMNLNKSRTAATNARKNLKTSLSFFDGIDAVNNESKTEAALDVGKGVFKFWKRGKNYDGLVESQEKENLKQLSPAEIIKQKLNPNTPAKNSEDYLTYKLKQWKIKEDKS